ncbi:stressosome-associated protein Prli42 [Mesobacillus boroniphilus]|uniref:stressosome-associated protein Prli42 n=1 Tax=Mesobacillus boroniphilus TaxID=308892 RepID=UPI0012E26B27
MAKMYLLKGLLNSLSGCKIIVIDSVSFGRGISIMRKPNIRKVVVYIMLFTMLASTSYGIINFPIITIK